MGLNILGHRLALSVYAYTAAKPVILKSTHFSDAPVDTPLAHEFPVLTQPLGSYFGCQRPVLGCCVE